MEEALLDIVIFLVVILVPLSVAFGLRSGKPPFALVVLALICIFCIVLLPFSGAIESWWKGETVRTGDKWAVIIVLLYGISGVWFTLVELMEDISWANNYGRYIFPCLLICLVIFGYGWIFGFSSFNEHSNWFLRWLDKRPFEGYVSTPSPVPQFSFVSYYSQVFRGWSFSCGVGLLSFLLVWSFTFSSSLAFLGAEKLKKR